MDIERLLDPRFLDLDPSPDPAPAAVSTARGAMAVTGRSMGRIADGALERAWHWTGDSDTDIRSGLYVAIQGLQESAGRVARALATAGIVPGPARGALTAATRARWDLHGVLGPLQPETLDADPGGGEWDVRHTLGHIIEAQRSYPWYTAWWLGRAGQPGLPARVPEDHGADLPSEEAQASGSSAQLRARLDAVLDLGASLWAEAEEADLATAARWSGVPVTVGFRTHRWAAHLAEHTIQVEKTLVMLQRPTTEVERLHRLLFRAYGELEAGVWAVPAAALEAPCEGPTVGGVPPTVGGALEAAAARARDLVDELAEVARD